MSGGRRTIGVCADAVPAMANAKVNASMNVRILNTPDAFHPNRCTARA